MWSMSSTLRVGQFGLQVIAFTLSPYLLIFLRKMSILAWPDYGAKLSSLCVDRLLSCQPDTPVRIFGNSGPPCLPFRLLQ